MDETYGTYVDDEYFDNHDYDDDTDDDNDHKNDTYTKKNKVLLLVLIPIPRPIPMTLAGHELIIDLSYGHTILSQNEALHEIYNSRWVPWSFSYLKWSNIAKY